MRDGEIRMYGPLPWKLRGSVLWHQIRLRKPNVSTNVSAAPGYSFQLGRIQFIVTHKATDQTTSHLGWNLNPVRVEAGTNALYALDRR